MACHICELLRQIEICLLELLRFWADDEQTGSYSGPSRHLVTKCAFGSIAVGPRTSGLRNAKLAKPHRLNDDPQALSVLNALMTDDIEVSILRWRLKIRSDGFKVRIPGAGTAGR